MAEITPPLEHTYSLAGRTYKAVDGQPVTSILTYPIQDLAGDYVKPDGGDWSKYPSHPVVNWAHGIPVGRGAVELKSLEFNGKVTNVAVGYTQFYKSAADLDGIDRTEFDSPTTRKAIGQYTIADCLRAAEDAEQLVRQDIATGVSIEFSPKGQYGKAYWDLPEYSPLEKRQARHFEIWNGYGYAHARRPVNAGCRTLIDDGDEVIEKCLKVAETGKLPGGHELSPLIMKSFKDDSLVLPRRFVRGGYEKLEEVTEVEVKAGDEPMAGVPHPLSVAAMDASDAAYAHGDPYSVQGTSWHRDLLKHSGAAEAAARRKDWGTAAEHAYKAEDAHKRILDYHKGASGNLLNSLTKEGADAHGAAFQTHYNAQRYFRTKAEEYDAKVSSTASDFTPHMTPAAPVRGYTSGTERSGEVDREARTGGARKRSNEAASRMTQLYRRAMADMKPLHPLSPNPVGPQKRVPRDDPHHYGLSLNALSRTHSLAGIGEAPAWMDTLDAHAANPTAESHADLASLHSRLALGHRQDLKTGKDVEANRDLMYRHEAAATKHAASSASLKPKGAAAGAPAESYAPPVVPESGEVNKVATTPDAKAALWRHRRVTNDVIRGKAPAPVDRSLYAAHDTTEPTDYPQANDRRIGGTGTGDRSVYAASAAPPADARKSAARPARPAPQPVRSRYDDASPFKPTEKPFNPGPKPSKRELDKGLKNWVVTDNPHAGGRTGVASIDRSSGNAYDATRYAHARTGATGNAEAITASTAAHEASNQSERLGSSPEDHQRAIIHHGYAEAAHEAAGEHDEADAQRMAQEHHRRAMLYGPNSKPFSKSGTPTEEAYSLSRSAHALTGKTKNRDAMVHSSGAMGSADDAMSGEEDTPGAHVDAAQLHGLAEQAHSAAGEDSAALMHGMAKRAHQLAAKARPNPTDGEGYDKAEADDAPWVIIEDTYPDEYKSADWMPKKQAGSDDAHAATLTAHAATTALKNPDDEVTAHHDTSRDAVRASEEGDHHEAFRSHAFAASVHRQKQENNGNPQSIARHGKAADLHEAAATLHRNLAGNETKSMDPKNVPSAGVRAVLNFAQFLMDGTDALLADSKRSDDINMRRLCKSVANKAQSWAAELATRAQEAKKQLDAADGDGTPNMSWSDDTQPVSVEAKSLDRDEDGLMVLVKAMYDEWEVRRYRPSNLKKIENKAKPQVEVKAEPVAVSPPPPAPTVEQADPKEWEAIQKRLAVAKTRASQYDTALNGRR